MLLLLMINVDENDSWRDVTPPASLQYVVIIGQDWLLNAII